MDNYIRQKSKVNFKAERRPVNIPKKYQDIHRKTTIALRSYDSAFKDARNDQQLEEHKAALINQNTKHLKDINDAVLKTEAEFVVKGAEIKKQYDDDMRLYQQNVVYDSDLKMKEYGDKINLERKNFEEKMKIEMRNTSKDYFLALQDALAMPNNPPTYIVGRSNKTGFMKGVHGQTIFGIGNSYLRDVDYTKIPDVGKKGPDITAETIALINRYDKITDTGVTMNTKDLSDNIRSLGKLAHTYEDIGGFRISYGGSNAPPTGNIQINDKAVREQIIKTKKRILPSEKSTKRINDLLFTGVEAMIEESKNII